MIEVRIRVRHYLRWQSCIGKAAGQVSASSRSGKAETGSRPGTRLKPVTLEEKLNSVRVTLFGI